MHWPKRDGYRFVDPDLGRIGVESIKKACWWGSSTSKHTAPRRTCSECRFSKMFSTEGNEKGRRGSKRGSDAGRRTCGAGTSYHGSAGKKRRFMQLCSMRGQLSLSAML